MGHHVGSREGLTPPGAAGQDHWFEPIAEHLGGAYLRYSFTKGTRQEADHLVGALGLQPGMRVLDVGCGPGRHAHELAGRGLVVHGAGNRYHSRTCHAGISQPAHALARHPGKLVN